MGIKTTKLGDDAALYNREPEKSTKQKWKEMNASQRLSFFMSYYFWPLVLGLIGVLFIGYIIYSVIQPKPEVIINAAASGYMYVDFTKIEDDYLDYLNTDKKTSSVSIDNSYALDTDTGSVQRFTVYSYAGDLDILFGDAELIKSMAESGFLEPLDTNLSAATLEKMEALGVTFSSKLVKRDYDGSVLEVGQERVYGLYIGELSFMKEYATENSKPAIGIVTNTKRASNAEAFINFLFEKYK